MSTAANVTRREVMELAWAMWRNHRTAAEPLTFAAALRRAWAHVKWQAAPAKPVRFMRLASPIYSPATRTLRGARYGRTLDRQAGRAIAALGR